MTELIIEVAASDIEVVTVDSGGVEVITVEVPGVQGPAGLANTLAIGTVNTLASGASATASITGSAPNQTLNLGLPTGPAPVVAGTSATSNSIAVASKTFTTQAGIQWSVGQLIKVVSRANTANFMAGPITDYTATSVTINVAYIGGSGTFTDWNLVIGGERGATGATGTAPVITSTSTTSLVIGTGSKVFTTAVAMNIPVGALVRAWATATPTNYMVGTVTAISGTTLTVNVTETGGSGTIAAWTISLTGNAGSTGPTGSTGPANTLAIGTVTTGAAGSSASATITGTAPTQTLNLTIPTGAQGPAGAGAPDATAISKGSVQLAGDLGGTAAAPTVPGLAGKASTVHTHVSTDITDSTAVGRSVLVATDAAAARTAIGAGTSSLAIGTTSTTAKAGDYAPPSDGAAGVATMRTLGTGATQAAAGTHTHTATGISDSTTVGRAVLTAVDAAAARTATGAGTSNLVIGTTSTTAKAGDYAPPIDGAVGVGTMRTLGTGALQAAAGNHTHTPASIGAAATSHTHAIADLTATGTKDATTYLRGDGTWAVPAGSGGTVTAANITDATTIGRTVLTSVDAAAVRTAIGAGTSSLALGSTGTTAAAGNHTHVAANITDSTTVGRSILTATDAAAVRTASGAAAATHTHVATTDLTATGTKDGTTYLRGDNTWAVPPGSPTYANLPAGTTITVLKAAGVWPARPTSRTDIIIAWKGADPDPAVVSSGTGGMLDNVDYRLVTT